MSSQLCKNVLNVLLDYACSAEFSQQMQVAQELYFIATGKVNDDDFFYDSRMAAFQEYFLFDYRLSELFSGSTVFETFLLNAQVRMNPAELHGYEQLRNFRHSLFEVEKHRSDILTVKDIFACEKLTATALPDYTFTGFESSHIFEGRLVQFDGINYFTGAFIFHPKEVSEIIRKHVNVFLRGKDFSRAEKSLSWNSELTRRSVLLKAIAEQRSNSDKSLKKRAVDILNITKQLVRSSDRLLSSNLVMSLGLEGQVSPFVPESCFYDQSVLQQRLSFCEIRSNRYRHLDPAKIYAFEEEPCQKHG